MWNTFAFYQLGVINSKERIFKVFIPTLYVKYICFLSAGSYKLQESIFNKWCRITILLRTGGQGRPTPIQTHVFPLFDSVINNKWDVFNCPSVGLSVGPWTQIDERCENQHFRWFLYMCGGYVVWMRVGCPYPPVRNDIVTLRHFFLWLTNSFVTTCWYGGRIHFVRDQIDVFGLLRVLLLLYSKFLHIDEI